MSDLIRFPGSKSNQRWEETPEYKSLIKLLRFLREFRLQQIKYWKHKDPKRYKKEMREYNRRLVGIRDEWDDRVPDLIIKDGKVTVVTKRMDKTDIKVIPLPRRID
ncbi:MAG: hypothetical protein QXL01_00060 [Thermoplasmatales archaeon]